MALLRRGTFTMGSTAFYPEEAPLRLVKVDPFWIDANGDGVQIYAVDLGNPD